MAEPSDCAEALGCRLVDLYAVIYERSMRDVPIVNQALSVERIGFRDFDAYVVGILITPWFMNLIAVGQQESETARAGFTKSIAFPAGDVEFISGHLAGFGPYYAASLFSPMFDFADMEAAKSTALEIMLALFSAPVEELTKPRDKSMDRRAFLRGSIGSDVASRGAPTR